MFLKGNDMAREFQRGGGGSGYFARLEGRTRDLASRNIGTADTGNATS